MTWRENIADDFGWLYDLIHDWQTLIAAMLATVAALLTIRAMRHQTQEIRRQDTDAMQRKALAARARMPDALRDMTVFCEKCAKRILDQSLPPPEKPLRALEDLKLAIEFVETEWAKKLFELLTHYQIYISRICRVDGGFVKEQLLYDSVKLHYLISRLFQYARAQEHEGDLMIECDFMINSMNEMFSLKDLDENEHLFDPVRKMIEKRHSQ